MALLDACHEVKVIGDRYRGKRARGLGAPFAIALLAAASIPAWAYQDEGTVRIGLLESQTGVLAPFGIPGLLGSQIAIEEINNAGGVTVDGRKVKLAPVPNIKGHDPANDPAQAIALTRRLAIDDGVLMIKGTTGSNLSEAVFNYLNELERQGTPVVVHTSSSVAPGLGKISKWGFRNSFSEVDIVYGVAERIQKQTGAKTAGFFIQQDNVYYPSIAEKAIMPALKRLNIEVKVVTDGVGTDRDFSRQVNALRGAQPDLIYVLGQTLPAINLLKEGKRRGLTPKVFIGGIAQVTAETIKSGAEAVEGMVMASSYDPDSPSVRKLGDEYKKRFSQDLSPFVVNGYEAIYLVKEAIEKSGIKNTKASLAEDRVKFRDAYSNASFTSVTGERIAFNADRDTPRAGVILVVKNGQFVAWNPGAAK